ncbi:MAG: bifunctional riboflavin kinase/FAD synthetase [Bacteroidota bacterium]
MNIITDVSSFDCSQRTIATTGTFDGVHAGHRAIIRRMTEIAKRENSKSVIVTFDPHPRQVLDPGNKDLKFITSLSEKKELIAALGVDCMLILPFTREFSAMPYDVFVKSILVEKLKTQKMVVGYDHNFGNRRTGNYQLLFELGARLGFDVEEVQPQLVNGIAVSSTKIRAALALGDIATANRYLGYNFMFSGSVIHGNHMGNKIGYPTANVFPNEADKLIPANGVYAVRIKYNQQWLDGMCNIGVKPTFGIHERGVEVNIFDFNSDIYGENVSVHFVSRLRDELKFADVSELTAQLGKDKIETILKLKG